MAFISDGALDAALNYITTNTVKLHICSDAPTSYAQATSGLSLGNKSGVSFSAPANATPNGRKATVAAFEDGSVTANGSATHWALVSASELLMVGTLTNSQVMTNGNKFQLSSIDFRIPDAA